MWKVALLFLLSTKIVSVCAKMTTIAPIAIEFVTEFVFRILSDDLRFEWAL